MVDKIKKYRRVIPLGFLPTLAVDSDLSLRLRWLSMAAVSKIPLGISPRIPYYSNVHVIGAYI